MGIGKKKRALTQILQAKGEETLPESDVKNKEHLAANMWTLATQGKVTFPDGREIKASVRDWKDAAQWIYQHIDGPVRIDDTQQGSISSALADMSLDELRSKITETNAKLVEVPEK